MFLELLADLCRFLYVVTDCFGRRLCTVFFLAEVGLVFLGLLAFGILYNRSLNLSIIKCSCTYWLQC